MQKFFFHDNKRTFCLWLQRARRGKCSWGNPRAGFFRLERQGISTTKIIMAEFCYFWGFSPMQREKVSSLSLPKQFCFSGGSAQHHEPCVTAFGSQCCLLPRQGRIYSRLFLLLLQHSWVRAVAPGALSGACSEPSRRSHPLAQSSLRCCANTWAEFLRAHSLCSTGNSSDPSTNSCLLTQPQQWNPKLAPNNWPGISAGESCLWHTVLEEWIALHFWSSFV